MWWGWVVMTVLEKFGCFDPKMAVECRTWDGRQFAAFSVEMKDGKIVFCEVEIDPDAD